MRGKANLLRIFFMSLLVLTSVSAETVLSSLEEIGRFGADRSLQVLREEIALREARDERIPLIRLRESSLTGTAQFDFIDRRADWVAALSLPVLDQVSLIGSLDGDFNGVLGISLSPLAHSPARELSNLQIQSARLSLEKAKTEGESQAISAALEWMKAARSYDVAYEKAALAEISYGENRERYELGGISFDELQDSLIQWSDRRKELSEAEQSLRQSERSLFIFTGDHRQQVPIPMLKISEIELSLSRLKENQSSSTPEAAKNRDLLLSYVDEDRYQTILKHTWSYEPALTAGASIAIGQEGTLAGSAEMTFSISPSDFQSKKRRIALERYELAAGESRSLRLQSDLLLRQSLEATVSAEINSEIARLELEQREILDSEAEHLLGTGDFSQLERELARISLKEAQNALFIALADEYLALIDLNSFY